MPPKPRPRLPTFNLPPRPPITKPPRHTPISTSTSTNPTTPPRAPTSTTHFLAKSLSLSLLTLSTALLLRDHILSLSLVTGSSMAPTLSPAYHETGERDLVLIYPFHASSSFENPFSSASASEDSESVPTNPSPSVPIPRNTIVTLWKPHRRSELSIKRVIAIEGDVVIPSRGYAAGKEVVVPRGHVWVEGDNWRGSWDSTGFGAVSLGLVEGRVGGVWRGGLRWERVGDGRGRGGRSRVVEGGGWVEGWEDGGVD